MASRAPKGQSFTAAAGRAAARRVDGTKKKAVEQGHSKRWLFGPYWLSSALTILAWVSRRASERAHPGDGLAGLLQPAYRGPAILSLLLLVTAVVVTLCQRRGHPLGPIDRGEEVAYVVGLLLAAAGWTAAVGMGALWPAAAGIVAASASASAYWFVGTRLRLPRWAASTLAGLLLAFVLYLLDPLRPRADFGPWLGAWALLTTVCSVPWWTHRGVRRGVSVDRSVGAWRAAAEEAGHEGIRVVAGSVEALPHGWRAKVALPGGQTWDDLAHTVRRQESLAGLRRGSLSVRPDPAELAHRALVQCVQADVHREPQDWPGPVARSIADPEPIGPRADGGVAEVRWWTPQGARHSLVAGMTGAGKSTLINTQFGGMAACLDWLPMGIDLKGRGIEFGPWRQALAALAVDLTQARGMLVAALAIIQARGVIIEARSEAGRRKFRRTWVPGGPWADGSEVDGSPQDGPFVHLFIDEAYECLGLDPFCGDLALRVAQLGRFAAVGLEVCTQRPAQDAIGNAGLRGQLTLGFVLGFKRPQDASFAIEGYEAYGLEPWDPAWRKRPGTLYVLGGEGDEDTLPARAYQMSEEQVDFIAAERAKLGLRLDHATATHALDAVAEVLASGDFRLPESEKVEIAAAAAAILRQAAGLDARPATASVRQTTPPPSRQQPATRPATPEVLMPEPATDPVAIDAEFARLMGRPLRGGFQVPEPAVPPSGPRTLVSDLGQMTAAEAIDVILDLAGRPYGVTPKEIMLATGFRSSWTDKNLAALVRAGKLVKADHGRYELGSALRPAAEATGTRPGS